VIRRTTESDQAADAAGDNVYATASEESPTGQKRPMPRSQRILLRMFSAIMGVAAGVVIIVLINRDTTPVVTQAILDEAMQRWADAAPANYDMEVETTGTRRQHTYQLQVRNGQVTALSIDGNALRKDRLTDTWTVPRQFEYIQNDLDAMARLLDPREMRLVANFDAKLGFPLRYRSKATKTRPETSWIVVRFEIVKP